MHSKNFIVSVHSLLTTANYKVINKVASKKKWYLDFSEVIVRVFNGRKISS